jgi:hypothetical protein
MKRCLLLGFFLVNLSFLWADLRSTFLLLGHPQYEVREEAFEWILMACEEDPYRVLRELESWKNYPDQEMRYALKRVEKAIEHLYGFDQEQDTLENRIFQLTLQKKFEEVLQLCKNDYEKSNLYHEDIQYLQSKLARILEKELLWNYTDIETQLRYKGETAYLYHQLYVYFFKRGQPLESFKETALDLYEQRYRGGQMDSQDDLKVTLLRYATFLFILGKTTPSQALFQEFQELPGEAPPLALALYYVQLQEIDKAFSALLKAIEEQGYEAWENIIQNEDYEALHQDPRFIEIQERKSIKRPQKK